MFKDTPKEKSDQRAQFGFGILIVTILMVILLGQATGILINTTDVAQSDTPDSDNIETPPQITNRVDVVETTGVVEHDPSAVTRVNMTTRLAPGSGPVNVSHMEIQWTQTDTSYKIIAHSKTESTNDYDATFRHKTIEDDDTSLGGDNTLNGRVDRTAILINLSASQPTGINSPLEEGDTVSVKIHTQSGGTTSINLVVPDSLSGKSSVPL